MGVRNKKLSVLCANEKGIHGKQKINPLVTSVHITTVSRGENPVLLPVLDTLFRTIHYRVLAQHCR